MKNYGMNHVLNMNNKDWIMEQVKNSSVCKVRLRNDKVISSNPLNNIVKNILYAIDFLFPIGNFGLTLETPVNKGFVFIEYSDNSIMLTKNNGFFLVGGKLMPRQKISSSMKEKPANP